jgi:hypothetical protein
VKERNDLGVQPIFMVDRLLLRIARLNHIVFVKLHPFTLFNAIALYRFKTVLHIQPKFHYRDRSVPLKKKRAAYTESIKVFGFCLFSSICVFKAQMRNLAINPPIASIQDAVALHEPLKSSPETLTYSHH